jgi:hypothetical protein
MSPADARLAALWAADAPPVADPQFVFAVMARAARRRLRYEILGLAPLAIAAAAILWATAPWLTALAGRIAPAMVTPAISAAFGGLAVAAWLWACVQGRHRSLALLGIDDAP